jgi:CRP-like cAMP-binding protein
MSSRSFSKNKVIFRQGDDAQEMFDIVSGSVGVYINYGQENETQLTILKAGNFLGEMGLIENYPRSATAVALEDGTRLQEIGYREFSEYFKTRPERLLAIMRQLSQRLRERTEDYESACKVLADLKATQGEPEKRSANLLQKAKGLLALYDSVMSSFGSAAYMSYFPSDRYLY